MIDKIQQGELIGHVGSPSSSTQLKVNLEEHAYSKGLVGNFCVVPFLQEGKQTFSIGQIVSIELRNPYLERHSIEKIISIRGEARPLTKEHDVINVALVPGSTYTVEGGKIVPSTMSTVPPTGTPVFLLGQPIVDEIVSRCQPGGIGYLGKMYNTQVLLPMFFRHFGKMDEGGLGEAYHIGIFGKTGSGKSVLARMIISLYARAPQMSIIVIDRTGEYVREIKNKTNLYKCLTSSKRTISFYDVSKISLTTPDALSRILLTSDILRRMRVWHPDNQLNAANIISEFFRKNKKIPLPDGQSLESLPNATQQPIFERMLEYVASNIARIYAGRDKQAEVTNEISDSYTRKVLYEQWVPIANLFAASRTTTDRILRESIIDRKIVFIDLSDISATNVLWNDRVLAIIIDEILKDLVTIASREWVRTGKLINTMVVLDEAHRFVPRETPEVEEFKTLKTTLVKGVLETRKYGLGWMFISQSLAGLDPELLRQLRMYFVGYGLSWGIERHTLDQLTGGAAIDLYTTFKDPQTAAVMGKREYSFMVVGPSSPLSISALPVFFNALDYDTEFLKYNFT